MNTLKAVLAQIALWLVFLTVLVAAWSVVARLGHRAKKTPLTMVWIQVLVMGVVGCTFIGALLLVTVPTPADRLLTLPVFAVGAAAALGAWALWRRVPRPEKPGTVESFAVPQSGEPKGGWPTVERARGPLQADPNERELVRARAWQVTDPSAAVPTKLLLTDRRLLLRADGEQVDIPRSRLLSVAYSTRRDVVTLAVATEGETTSIVLAGTQFFSSGRPFTRAYRLYQALQAGLLNPRSIGTPLVVEPPAYPRRWVIAAVLSLTLGAFGLVLMVDHYLDLRKAAQLYDHAPICESGGPVPCRLQESAVVLDTGNGAHPDGSTGGKFWIQFRAADGTMGFADLVAYPTVKPSTGEFIGVERWQGQVTLVNIQDDIETTYVNPDFAARDFRLGIGLAVVAVIIAVGLCGWAAWRDLKRERRQPLALAA